MSELDTISRSAQQVLSIPAAAGGTDNWLWDRTLRIVHNVDHICRLPELATQGMAVDRFCLTAAALFAESGGVRCPDTRDASMRSLPAEVGLADLCLRSTRVVSDKLAGLAAEPRIDRINRIITESFNRLTTLIEAMILADARNLDDMGAVGLYNEYRRSIIQGKGVSDILESWKRKIDYRYWQARLKEDFRFESVRELAARRFAAAEQMMNQLAVENTAGDFAELLRQFRDSQKLT